MELTEHTKQVIPIIKVMNVDRQTTAILENAYNISYTKEANAIWQASFSLPLNDPKVQQVKLLQYVEITDDDEYIGLFRVIPKQTSKSESLKEVNFQCEHVLATLMDKYLFKYWQRSNFTTSQNIDFLLDQQNHKHWIRGKTEFTRYFHYSWENDNLISALFSIPRPFDKPYLWEHDTQTYPWKLSLVEPDMEPICRIKEGHNLIGLEIEENPMSSYNRIYPLGAGEGVNQLTITSVNNGVPYLEDRKPGEEIREYVWSDQRFTDGESLKASAIALLKKFKEPQVTWKVSAADVSKITGLSIDKFQVGKVVRLDIEGWPIIDLRIMKVSKPDIKGDPGNIQLEIGNVVEDLSTTQADLEHRQQINELYSQGATNIMNFTYQDNCDSEIGATIPFYIDEDVVNINTIELTYRTKRFRAYSQATHGGGAIVKSTKGGGGTTESTTSGGGVTRSTTSGGAVVKSTSSGGGTTATSSNGGGLAKSTASGGATTRTSSAGGGFSEVTNPYWDPTEGVIFVTGEQRGTGESHLHELPAQLLDHTHLVSAPNHTHNTTIPAHTHSFDIPNHNHSVTVPNHTHQIDIPNHSHEVTIPAHSHSVTVPEHTHEIELPDHTHEVEHKIVELSELPSKVTVKVDGNVVAYTSTTADRLDLVDYLNKDNSGKISRGRHEIEIIPDGHARIEADLICRVFIQSQLGGNF